MSIANPKGYFKIGRIFKTDRTEMQDLILIVVGERSDSAICCVSDGPSAGQEDFPIIAENPFVTIESPLRLNFNKQYEVEHYHKVLNIGRIDRKYLKALEDRHLMGKGGNTLLYNAAEDHHADQSVDESRVESLSVAEGITVAEITAAESGSILPKSREFQNISINDPKTKSDPLFKG
jgi:hypothetical protein